MKVSKYSFSKASKSNLKRKSHLNSNLAEKNKCPYNKQYSSEHLKANYLLNFKGRLEIEQSDNNLKYLNHETYFFREPITDEIVQNYILSGFSNDDEVNIVSGACSSGEEAKSYAMMLDSFGEKLHIFGFDISDDVIKSARQHKTHIFAEDDKRLSFDIGTEKFLSDENTVDLTQYQKKCLEKFSKYYKFVGKPYELPLKNEKAESSRKSIFKLLSKFNHKPLCYVYQDVDAIDGSFDNCTFTKGDVLKLKELYQPNSINVLLYRNALYHTLCKEKSGVRVMADNAKEKMLSIAEQMNKVLKKGGLVVFGENEDLEGVSPRLISYCMLENGFRRFGSDDISNIWVKI